MKRSFVIAMAPVIAIACAVKCGGATTGDDAGADGTSDVFHLDVHAIDVVDFVDAAPDTSTTCDPSLPDAYAPTWIPPASPSTVCTSTQIQSLYDTCVGQQSSSACQSFEADTSNATCTACMETPLAASAYGPILSWHNGDSLEVNVAGCMALVDGDVSANGCGATYEKWQSCFIAACDTCPEGTFESCSTPAQAGACGTYETAAMNCLNEAQYAPCRQTTFESYFTTYGALFCAGGLSDASGE